MWCGEVASTSTSTKIIDREDEFVVSNRPKRFNGWPGKRKIPKKTPPASLGKRVHHDKQDQKTQKEQQQFDRDRGY